MFKLCASFNTNACKLQLHFIEINKASNRSVCSRPNIQLGFQHFPRLKEWILSSATLVRYRCPLWHHERLIFPKSAQDEWRSGGRGRSRLTCRVVLDETITRIVVRKGQWGEFYPGTAIILLFSPLWKNAKPFATKAAICGGGEMHPAAIRYN